MPHPRPRIDRRMYPRRPAPLLDPSLHSTLARHPPRRTDLGARASALSTTAAAAAASSWRINSHSLLPHSEETSFLLHPLLASRLRSLHRSKQPHAVTTTGHSPQRGARHHSMGAGIRVLAAVLALAAAAAVVTRCAAQLKQDYYAAVCPDVESIVRDAVSKKVQETPIAVGATLRLFFHDCFVEGCDASVILVSTGNNTAEKDHPSNLSLAGDGFDTVIKAKAAVDAVPQCTNQVSCADILALATRDVIELAGGPSYAVELGRLDGLSSTSTSVDGKLPPPSFNLDQLTAIFAANNLSQTDMIALSAAHTVGFAHCSTFSSRIQPASVDPTLDASYAAELQAACPAGVDPNIALEIDPITPHAFDNQYFVNLVQGRGLLTSDQVLYSDDRSRPIVVAWSQNSSDFEQAFVAAMTNLGRVGVKTDPSQGNIRRDCAFLNN